MLATIRVGTVKLDSNGVPELDRVIEVRHALVRNGKRTVVRMHVASTPVTVTVTMPTFSTPTDPRLLAAQPKLHVRAGPALAREPNRARRRIARMSRAASPKATISSPREAEGREREHDREPGADCDGREQRLGGDRGHRCDPDDAGDGERDRACSGENEAPAEVRARDSLLGSRTAGDRKARMCSRVTALAARPSAAGNTPARAVPPGEPETEATGQRQTENAPAAAGKR